MSHHYPDDLEVLPQQAWIDGLTYESSCLSHQYSDEADYVVVGSGAAGATAAWTLASAGFSVIILEEGPWVRTRDFGVDVYPAMKQMFRDCGTQVSLGRSVLPVLQGCCVGGSTTINSAISWRMSEEVIQHWNEKFNLKGAISYQELEKHYAFLEEALLVQSVQDFDTIEMNRIFQAGARAMKVNAQSVERYGGACDASASCLTGCRTGKKLSMNITFIPRALQQGAKIYTSARALSVEQHYGRVTGVQVVFQKKGLSRSHAKIRVKRGVILAASAVQTPGILKRSGIRSRALGKYFQAHPGTSLIACFAQPVQMQHGPTQGFNSVHFAQTHRIKLETLSLPSEMLALRIPGIGPEWIQKVMRYPYLMNCVVALRAESLGKVMSFLGQEQIVYSLSKADMFHLREGLRKMSELLFLGGAQEVWPAVTGMPVLRSLEDLSLWDRASLDARDYGLMMSHLFSSARMGCDPRTSVVDTKFQVHGVHGLYVLDSSVFPTNIGVNPQHTIMAMASLGATRIAQ